MSGTSPLRGITVLVVDDDEATRYAWHRVLARAGATVKAVKDGETALQALRDDQPDVLVTDLVMPGIDGFQLLTSARSLERPAVSIAITAFDDRGQRARALRAGFAAYLTKPIESSVLIQEIARCVGLERPGTDFGEAT